MKIHWNLWNKPPKLLTSEVCLNTYTNEPVKAVGELDVVVQHNGQDKVLPLLVLPGNGVSLLGRNWLGELILDWLRVLQFHQSSGVQSVLAKYPELFRSELGTLQGNMASLKIDPSVQPIFFKARPVPYALKPKIDLELDRLLADGIIEPVQHSQWAAPIVPVVKADGSIRICGDYKLTVNTASKVDSYPLPNPEDLFATLAGGKYFSTLDLSHAYLQILMDDASKPYLTVNTHRGLFTYNRLPFGVSSSPGIFQRVVDTVMGGCPGVAIFLDDIIVTGKTEEEHITNLNNVLSKLSASGLRLRREKCVFQASEVRYLGHCIDSEGLHTLPDKVRAIVDAPAPSNVSELKAFLGMLTYYQKFLPGISTVLEPLHLLLRKSVPWKWSVAQKKSFVAAKHVLQSSSVLVHYDPNKPLVLACDASPYGLGAVLSQIMEDGVDMNMNGIKHICTAPYHARSNGLAERAVQTFKEGMKRQGEKDSIQTRVSRFLFKYRLTPQTTTGISPAEMLMKRRPKSRMDLLAPDVHNKVVSRQEKSKSYHDNHARNRTFNYGEHVYIRNFGPGSRYIPATVVDVTGPVSYGVQLRNSKIVKRHVDHIFARLPSGNADTIDENIIHDYTRDGPTTPSSNIVNTPASVSLVPQVPPDTPVIRTEDRSSQPVQSDITSPVGEIASSPNLRRSSRVSVKPERYGIEHK